MTTTTLTEHDPRCDDAGCHERLGCLRWKTRYDVPMRLRSPSLFPYDQPLGDPCPMRVPKQAAAGGEA